MMRHALWLASLFAVLTLCGCAAHQGSLTGPEYLGLASVRAYLGDNDVVTRYQMQSLPDGYLRIVDVETVEEVAGERVTARKRYFIWPARASQETHEEVARRVKASTPGATDYFRDDRFAVLVVETGRPRQAFSFGAVEYEAVPSPAGEVAFGAPEEK